MEKRGIKALCLATAVLLFSGCGGTPLVSGEHSEVKLSAWSAYWDAPSGVREYKLIKSRLDKTSSFAAYFNSDDKLFLPKEMEDISPDKMQAEGKKVYLTVVNDYADKKGKFKLKDLEVLHRVLGSREKRAEHAAGIVRMAKDAGYDGVDLDYERVFKDETLVPKFLDFTYLLSREATENDLALRIILEPSAPFTAEFCKGPEYVVMLYNLYGTHSNPGPKADGKFIRETIKKMEALPGKKGVAFAAGGCVWERSGLFNLQSGPYKKQIDENTAAKLREKHQAKAQRDAESAALYFDYEENGKKYTVWYADSETLNAWITAAAANGIDDITVWRLGGNSTIEGVRK